MGAWGEGFGGWIFRQNHRRIQNLDPYGWRDRFTVKNTDEITDGFECQIRTRNVTGAPSKNTDGITEGFEKAGPAVTCRFPVIITDVFTDGVGLSVSLSETLNRWPPCRHSPPPFLLLLPNPKSPHLQITSPPSPPNKNLSHLSSCISWSFVVTASVFWFTDGFYQFL